MADIVKVKQIQDSSGTSHDIAARSLLDSSGNEYTSDSFLKLTGGTLTGTLNIKVTGSNAKLVSTGTPATVDYFQLYVTDDSASTHRPLVLQNGYGNVGIGVVAPAYKLDVNGSMNATTLYENGTSLASKYLGISATAADSSKLNGQAANYYLNYNNLTNKPTIPSVSNATITIKQTGISDQTFTLNGSATTITLADTNTHYTNYFQIKGSGTEAAKFIQSGDVSLNFVGSGATSVSASSGTITISSTDNDTKNTAGSTDTSSKIFLIGATSQAANPQTYSDNEVFATSGVLSAKSFNLAPGATSKATIQYNTTDDCIDFIFS